MKVAICSTSGDQPTADRHGRQSWASGLRLSLERTDNCRDVNEHGHKPERGHYFPLHGRQSPSGSGVSRGYPGHSVTGHTSALGDIERYGSPRGRRAEPPATAECRARIVSASSGVSRVRPNPEALRQETARPGQWKRPKVSRSAPSWYAA